MLHAKVRLGFLSFSGASARLAGSVFCGVLALAASLAARAQATQNQASQDQTGAAAPAQQPAATTDSGSQPAAQQPVSAQAPQSATATQETPAAAPATAAQPTEAPEITEDEIKNLLVGKQLFLRGGYLDNALSFNEHGVLIGHSAQGSYTLNAIQIDKIHLTKHKVELDGERYGLHFLGALAYEDPTAAVDRVNITPKKKEVKITIDRELVVKPKQEKSKLSWLKFGSKSDSADATPKPAPAAPTSASAAPVAACSPCKGNAGDSEAQAEIAAAPAAERPADPKSVTTTTSPAHANKVLLDALQDIFAQPFDARMMDAMPGFWKLYYEAAAAKTDYHPKDPAVLRQNMVDQKAHLVSRFEPASNQFAQDSGVAGMSLYHVVIGADGKPGEIAVARPIGFGLDESAVDSIRKATFEPAMKDGKPVPVVLDLVVEFRIYSKRTNVASTPEGADPKGTAALPGPYGVQHQ